jgi:hypothetical protein
MVRQVGLHAILHACISTLATPHFIPAPTTQQMEPAGAWPPVPVASVLSYKVVPGAAYPPQHQHLLTMLPLWICRVHTFGTSAHTLYRVHARLVSLEIFRPMSICSAWQPMPSAAGLTPSQVCGHVSSTAVSALGCAGTACMQALMHGMVLDQHTLCLAGWQFGLQSTANAASCMIVFAGQWCLLRTCTCLQVRLAATPLHQPTASTSGASRVTSPGSSGREQPASTPLCLHSSERLSPTCASS